MKIESAQYQDGRCIAQGSVGQTEDGKAMAAADYLSSGGIAHHPAAGEKGVILPVNGSRYYALIGCDTAIELREGETALFAVKNGQVQGMLLAKEDGTFKLNDGSDSAVIHGPLKAFFDDLKLWLNTHTHANHGVPPAAPFTGELNAKSKDLKLS